MPTVIRSLLLFFLLTIAVQPAAAAGRQALVIGIDEYEELPRLNKAVGDARAMAEKLRELGFEVTEAINPDRRSLNRDLSSFARRLSSGDVALVHFSGHGIEIEGQNYLLPADSPKPESGNSAFVKSEALAMGDLIRQVADSGAATRVFIIDACRDNPFQQSGVRSIGGTRGLARVEPAGTLILYSAGYGQTALDRLGDVDPSPTSVYTRVLLEKMGEPGMKLRDVAVEVRKEVEALAKSVGHEQRPAYYDELSSDLALVQGGAAAPRPKPEPRKQPAAADNSVELAYWDSIKDSKNPAMFESYLRRYPSGQFADLANIMLEGLKGEADAEQAQREAERLKHEKELAAIRAEAERLRQEAELQAIRKEAERLRQEARADDSRATPQQQQRYHYIVGLDPSGDNWLALKAKPDIKSKRLRKMGPETLLIVTGQQGNWVRVRLMDGTEGWAFGKYIACCTTLN